MILIALLLFWGLSGVNAQSNTMASGGEATGSGGTISYSIGQIDYIEATGSGGTANQGVQQPFEIFTLGTDERPDIDLEITVYPNPAVSNVTLRIGNFTSDNLSYQLYDLNGRLLYQQKLQNAVTQIPFEGLASAIYLLQVLDRSSQIKSFKIIKN